MADENRSEIDINISVCGSRLNLIRFAIRHSFLFSWSHILSEQHLGRNRNNRVGGLQTLGLQLGPSLPLPRRLEPELPSVLRIDDPRHSAPRRLELAAAAHIETQKQHQWS